MFRNRFPFQFFLVAMLLVLAMPGFAQRVEGERARAVGLYAAEVTVNNQTAGERGRGLARGLMQVLQRLTGDRNITARPGVGDELRRAGQYVDKYDYRQDEGLSPSGAPSFKTTLVVQYDQAKVDAIVTKLNLQYWPQPRPKPVLWLAINDGTGARLVGADKSAAARPVLDRAVQRGYRLGLPAGNAAEQALVGAIWRGDTAAIARASAKYSPPMQLIGKLYRNPRGWQADWVFVMSGKEVSRWSANDTDARRAMATGADGAADALIKRFAKAPKPLPPPPPVVTQEVVVSFTGVNSTSDFMRLAAYLEGSPAVKRAVPVRATPDAMVYEVELVGGLGELAKVGAKDGVLEQVEGTTFRLR